MVRIRGALKSKKVQAGIVATVFTLCITGGLFVWSHTRDDKYWTTKNTCEDYSGTYDPAVPAGIKEFAQEARGIIVGTVLNPEAYASRADSGKPLTAEPLPRIHITQVLKGAGVLREGDTITLCAGTGIIDFNNAAPSVLFFLEGRNKNVWVPQWGRLGIAPQDNDQKFTLHWASNFTGASNPPSFTIDELKMLIK